MRKIFNIMLAFMLLCSSAFAGTKISELSELTAGAGDDFFAIVDDTDTTTKKITRDSLFGGELIVDDTYRVIKNADVAVTNKPDGGTPWDVTDIQVHHYYMDDDAATTVLLDNEGVTNATLVGGNTTAESTVSGKINSAITLGGSADYINSNWIPDFTGDVDISVWMKADIATPKNEAIFGADTSGDDRFFFYTASTGTLYLYLGDVGGACGTTKIDDTDPHHYRVFYDHSEGTVKAYKDTVEIGSFSPTNIDVGTQELAFGAMFSGGSASNHWDGYVDDFRYMEGAMDAADYTGIYNSGDGTQDDSAGTAIPIEDVFAMTDGVNPAEFEHLPDSPVGSIGTVGDLEVDGVIYSDGTLIVDGEAYYESTDDMGTTDVSFTSKSYVDTLVAPKVAADNLARENFVISSDADKNYWEASKYDIANESDYISFGVVTDVHMELSGGDTDPGDLATMIADFNTEVFDFVIQLGDAIYEDWDLITYETFIEEMNGLRLHYYNVAGNHDIGGDDLATNLSAWETASGLTESYYAFSVKDVLFVVLNNNYNSGGALTDVSVNAGYLSTAQATWLDTLVDNTTYEKLVVFSHYPVSQTTQGLATRTILEDYETAGNTVIGVFSGHAHANALTTITGIDYYTLLHFFSGASNNYSKIYIDSSDTVYVNGVNLQTTYGTEGTYTTTLNGSTTFDILGEAVGINTTSPNEALHVVGSIEIEDNSNNCKLIVDTDGTCDTGTSIGTDTSIALCLSCS